MSFKSFLQELFGNETLWVDLGIFAFRPEEVISVAIGKVPIPHKGVYHLVSVVLRSRHVVMVGYFKNFLYASKFAEILRKAIEGELTTSEIVIYRNLFESLYTDGEVLSPYEIDELNKGGEENG